MSKFKAEAPKIRVEDHYEFGRVLQMFRLKLMDKIRVKSTKKEQRECYGAKALQNIDELRNQMDNIICKEYPKEETDKLIRAYYGAKEKLLDTPEVFSDK